MILDTVHAEDRPIIRNVVAVIEVIKPEKILTAWEVQLGKGCYIVTAFIRDDTDCEFSTRELESIHDVNPLRVLSASVSRQNAKLSIKVRISDRDTPLMLTETQIVQVCKRSRWLK